MKILVLSFYYPPDIGPGALRADSIVEALLEQSKSDVEIKILTTKPNRYHSMDINSLENERTGLVSILRINLPKHQSGMLDQAWAFSIFARKVLKETHGGQYNIVVATSGRLMTALLGAWIARRSKAKLFLDIRDLFTETIGDILKSSIWKWFLPLFYYMERWTFRSADALNIVSGGFLGHIRKILPDYEPLVFTNGIDDEFLLKDFSSHDSGNLPLVLYAGNIGESQALHAVIPPVAKMLEGRVRFRVIGGGGRKRELEKARDQLFLKNVEIINPVYRWQLFDHYCEASILFLHLNSHKAFQSVLPSKLFEYAAVGKPILAGVNGYAADFIGNNIHGVELFKPCDVLMMKNSILKILERPYPIERDVFLHHYSRKKIMNEMALKIIELELNKK